jgi:hypothetical protein
VNSPAGRRDSYQVGPRVIQYVWSTQTVTYVLGSQARAVRYLCLTVHQSIRKRASQCDGRGRTQPDHRFLSIPPARARDVRSRPRERGTPPMTGRKVPAPAPEAKLREVEGNVCSIGPRMRHFHTSLFDGAFVCATTICPCGCNVIREKKRSWAEKKSVNGLPKSLFPFQVN